MSPVSRKRTESSHGRAPFVELDLCFLQLITSFVYYPWEKILTPPQGHRRLRTEEVSPSPASSTSITSDAWEQTPLDGFPLATGVKKLPGKSDSEKGNQVKNAQPRSLSRNDPYLPSKHTGQMSVPYFDFKGGHLGEESLVFHNGCWGTHCRLGPVPLLQESFRGGNPPQVPRLLPVLPEPFLAAVSGASTALHTHPCPLAAADAPGWKSLVEASSVAFKALVITEAASWREVLRRRKGKKGRERRAGLFLLSAKKATETRCRLHQKRRECSAQQWATFFCKSLECK